VVEWVCDGAVRLRATKGQIARPMGPRYRRSVDGPWHLTGLDGLPAARKCLRAPTRSVSVRSRTRG